MKKAPSNKTKQVSIMLPEKVVATAAKVAERSPRPDGMRQSTAAQLREWLLKGMELSNAEKS